MEIFIGLVFDSNSEHYKKIDSFKKRFDPKYIQAPLVQLTILPPFEIEFTRLEYLKRFKSDINEIIDGHLMGLGSISQIEFNGITFTMGKKGLLGLTPKLSLDFDHLKESLYDFLKEEGAKFKKLKSNTNLILPIGRFDYPEQLEEAIDIAKLEFSSPFMMNAKQFVLFERSFFIWTYNESIYEFQHNQHFNFVNNLWVN